MADTRNISQPSQGSEELGTETNSSRNPDRPSAGTDTQLHLAAKSGKNRNRNINDDEKVVKNSKGQEDFLTSDETDE